MFNLAAALERTRSSGAYMVMDVQPKPAVAVGHVEAVAKAVSAVSAAVDPLSRFMAMDLRGNNQAVCEILKEVSNDLTRVSSALGQKLRAIGGTITALVIEKNIAPENIQLLVEYFPKVISLQLNALQLGEMHFSKFSDFEEIKTLGVHACRFDAACSERCFLLLQVFIHMTTLVLENCRGVGKEALESVCLLSELHHLSIIGSEHVTDEYIERLTTAVSKNLRELSFAGCLQVTDGVVPILEKRCPQLKKLSLAYCQRITNDALIDISRRFSYIESLNFSGCTQITDAGVFFLIPEEYEQFTQAASQDEVVQKCTFVAAFHGITVAPIVCGSESLYLKEARVKHLTRLRAVYLHHCPKVSHEYRAFLNRSVRQVCYFP